MSNSFGIVVIGRNEGERLSSCFASLNIYHQRIVYVDSGSTDESIILAKKYGIDVIELDPTIPFSAARARNEGFRRLLNLYPSCKYVMFVDGDCEVADGWIDKAITVLDSNKNVAVVCGRCRERFPQKSVYNMLCDIEWDTPVGETNACGGNSVMRVPSFQDVGGFRSNLIAGEESELCHRLRMKGLKIWRIDAEMCIHDVNMYHFKQWWKRSVRSGHAYAEVFWLYHKDRVNMRQKEVKSILLWGIILPVLIFVTAFFFISISFFLLFGYAVMFSRVFRHILSRNRPRRDAFLYSFFCVLSRFSEAVGLMKFFINTLLRKQNVLIEY